MWKCCYYTVTVTAEMVRHLHDSNEYGCCALPLQWTPSSKPSAQSLAPLQSLLKCMHFLVPGHCMWLRWHLTITSVVPKEEMMKAVNSLLCIIYHVLPWLKILFIHLNIHTKLLHSSSVILIFNYNKLQTIILIYKLLLISMHTKWFSVGITNGTNFI